VTLLWINPRTIEKNALQVSEQALSVLMSFQRNCKISSTISRSNPIVPMRRYEIHNPWRSTGVRGVFAQQPIFLKAGTDEINIQTKNQADTSLYVRVSKPL